MVLSLFVVTILGLAPQLSQAQVAEEPQDPMLCPDLTGKYVCRYEKGNQRLTLKFSQNENEAAVYTVNSTINLIADNVSRQYGLNRYQAKCEGEWLSIKQRVVLTDYQGYHVGFAQLLTRWKKSGDSLVETNDGYTVIHGISRPVRTTYFCEKK